MITLWSRLYTYKHEDIHISPILYHFPRYSRYYIEINRANQIHKKILHMRILDIEINLNSREIIVYKPLFERKNVNLF